MFSGGLGKTDVGIYEIVVIIVMAAGFGAEFVVAVDLT
jgi:hypothetical protein